MPFKWEDDRALMGSLLRRQVERWRAEEAGTRRLPRTVEELLMAAEVRDGEEEERRQDRRRLVIAVALAIAAVVMVGATVVRFLLGS